MIDVLVIGGGASGLMAAISAATAGCHVEILEKMASCGKKIRITGKGRCNVTTDKTKEEIIKSIRRNPRFMYSSLSVFDNNDVKDFFEKHGCPLKVERGERLFPVSDRAQDVVDVLTREAEKKGVVIHRQMRVTSMHHDEHVFVVEVAGEKKFVAKSVIICTGGASYSGTGSTGDGYKWLDKLGIRIVDARPALVPLVAKESWVKSLQGLSLKNVCLSIERENHKSIYLEQGEMLFTHFGISGPIVLSASGHCTDYWRKNNAALIAHIDLKPALSEAQLDKRLLREIEESPNKQYNNLLRRLMPQKMLPVFIQKTGISGEKILHQLTKEDRLCVIRHLKDFSFHIDNARSLEEGIVTAGGVDVKEINPKTMAIKKIEGLFVAGEIIDVDAYTGGFNLQIAFSTGYSAGKAACQFVHEKEL